jgi:hypothetical protein
MEYAAYGPGKSAVIAVLVAAIANVMAVEDTDENPSATANRVTFASTAP